MKLQYRAQVLSAFGDNLKSLRLKKGFTLRQFEIKSGIDAGNLVKYERGTREPGLIVILIMARALDIHYHDLFNFEFDFNETALRRSVQL